MDKSPATGFRKLFVDLKNGRYFIYTGKIYRKEWRVCENGRVFFGIEIVSGEIMPIPQETEIVTIEKWEIERHLTALSMACEGDKETRKLALLREVKHSGNVSAACRKYGYSRDSFYRFRRMYASKLRQEGSRRAER